MKKIYILIAIIFPILSLYSQVLWSENFDNYQIGTFTNGQGGWNTGSFYGGTGDIMNEPNRGNVLNIYKNGGASNNGAQLNMSKYLGTILDTRTSGNDIIMATFDFYMPPGWNGLNVILGGANLQIEVSSSGNVKVFNRLNQSNHTDAVYFLSNNTKTLPGGSAYYGNFPFNTWVSVEIYVDYTTKNIHFYIPLLNINNYRERIMQQAIPTSTNVRIWGMTFNSISDGLKCDNLQISAIKTLPTYLSVKHEISTKFNMYPNPATNVVHITNSENMLVNQITIYDISGKQLSTQKFTNENQIQLNVENLASGTYMLHLQTNEGVAVKKLVKD